MTSSLSDKAIIDTTVLFDALMLETGRGEEARAAIRGFAEVLVPQYAIKELKKGPLGTWKWVHNKVVVAVKWSEVMDGVAALYWQKYKLSTSLAAITAFESSFAEILRAKHGGSIPTDKYEAIKLRHGRLRLKTKIFEAWENRYKAPLKAFWPLQCYDELGPVETAAGAIDDTPVNCARDCVLRKLFSNNPTQASALEAACRELESKDEMKRRGKVIADILRKPGRELTTTQCKHLGDAVFAMLCPDDAVVLTTNIVDHQPLAAALSKTAIRPTDVS